MTETIIPIPTLLEDLSSNKSRNRKLWGTGTHFSGNRVIRPQSPPALILFTAACLREVGQSLTPHRHGGNTL
jgi:hypothetical protein